MKTVYTGGTFDLFHDGHVNFLSKCRSIGDKVVVALNTDEFVTRYKNKSPIHTLKQRISILKSCRYVDDVVINEDGEDSKPSILKVKPDFIAVGSDWAKKDYFKQLQVSRQWLDDHQITICYFDYTEGISSTEIRASLIPSFETIPFIFVIFSPEFSSSRLYKRDINTESWSCYSWHHRWIKIDDLDSATALLAYNQAQYVFSCPPDTVINI